MRQQDIKIGSTYIVKVSNQLVKVKIIHQTLLGEFIGLNLQTKRQIKFKTGARLRYLADF